MRTAFIFIFVMITIITIALIWYFNRKKILVIGDSLSCPFELPKKDGWVYKISKKLGWNWVVCNDSKNGRTAEEYEPKKGNYDIVIIELGGNDMLNNGYKCLPKLKQKLTSIVRFYQETGARILLLGIVVPPEKDMIKAENMYKQISINEGTNLVPLFMNNIGSNFLEDKIHPTSTGHDILAKNVWKELRKMTTTNSSYINCANTRS
jgi:acyl-CoA thioesterase I